MNPSCQKGSVLTESLDQIGPCEVTFIDFFFVRSPKFTPIKINYMDVDG